MAGGPTRISSVAEMAARPRIPLRRVTSRHELDVEIGGAGSVALAAIGTGAAPLSHSRIR
jgi:hypothetical protein